jgi:hypothetical protein
LVFEGIMRQIEVKTIIAAVKKAAIAANYEQDEDMLAAFAQGDGKFFASFWRMPGLPGRSASPCARTAAWR